MHQPTIRKLPQAKSYSSIYDLTEQSEIKKSNYNKYPMKNTEDMFIFQTMTDNEMKKKFTNDSEMLNQTLFVTSERYHSLNKKSSDKSVIRSTSTFFYDLDSLAKSHSYHCKSEVLESKKDIDKKCNGMSKTGFGAKSEAIVQECATQMKPKLLTAKNIKENKKKVNKSFPHNTLLSSEIFLRDNEDMYTPNIPQAGDISLSERQQKFWSFTKYRAEYTNPVTECKNSKKKDHGKRTEDPCPCQLFSYACPCTNKKSLTELAKNSKCLTVADQITSTPQMFEEKKCKKLIKTKKGKNVRTYDVKMTSTIDMVENKSKEVCSDETHTGNTNNNDMKKKSDNVINNITNQSFRKLRKVLCPNCKEMIDIMSTTEDEESLKSKSSPHYRNNELSPSATHAYQSIKEDKSKIVESRDICNHEPQCELVPVCQILPTDNVYASPNMTHKQSPLKPNARVIRITKGCRHHPPCTVVPSCQRTCVLNNNCEYIPPCLHRPHCVNLPLCAPHSKSIYYDEIASKPEEDIGTTECLHLHQNRYTTAHHHDSLENQMTRVQNTCEYLSECSPRFMINSTLGSISPIPSPCQPISFSLLKHCRSEKSCQYDFWDLKQNLKSSVKETLSNHDVIFIRDVGCQFRNKNYSPKDSIIQSKSSSDSYNCLNMNIDNYSTNFHTLRYEDKFTIPISGEEISVSTVTRSSTEIDSQCPTHGHRNRHIENIRPTGFVPKSTRSPFIAYTNTDDIANFCSSVNDTFKKKLESNPAINKSMSKGHQNSLSVKSRSSFLKGKYKDMCPVRRRRKSRASCYASKALLKKTDV